jgi:hypothetical protein
MMQNGRLQLTFRYFQIQSDYQVPIVALVAKSALSQSCSSEASIPTNKLAQSIRTSQLVFL